MVKKAVKRVTKTRAVNSVFETVANHYGIPLEDLLAYPKNVRDLMIKDAGLPTKEPKVNSGKRITADQVRSWIPADRTDVTGWYLPKEYLPFTRYSVVGGTAEDKIRVTNEFFEKGYVAGCKALRDFLPDHSEDVAYTIKVDLGYNKAGAKYIIPSVWVDLK